MSEKEKESALSDRFPDVVEAGAEYRNESWGSCLVLLLFIFIVLVLLAPLLSRKNEKARQLFCTNNLKQIASAIQQYREYFGTLPPVYTVDEQGKALHSWRVLILPYLENQRDRELYSQIRLDEPWDSEYNRGHFHGAMPRVYRCPSERHLATERRYDKPTSEKKSPQDPSSGICSYSIVQGEGSPFSLLTEKSERGTSNRIMIVERKKPINWMVPDKELTTQEILAGINCSETGSGSSHPGGMNAAFEDGSVRYLNDKIDKKVLRAMLSGK